MMISNVNAMLQFSGVTVLRSLNQSKLAPAAKAQNLYNPISAEYGPRQAGPIHEFVAVTGKDTYAAFEAMFNVTLPETLKALPPEEGFVKLGTDENYIPFADQAEAYARAMSSGGMMDIGPSLNLSNAYFEYLGYCKGKGQTADGTPVNVINLDA
jgi:hypothetical protein